jgi:hypothetical protein
MRNNTRTVADVFSVKSLSYQIVCSERKVDGSPHESLWFHDSQSREIIKCDHESRGTRNQEWRCERRPEEIYTTDRLILPRTSFLNYDNTDENGEIKTIIGARGSVVG